MSGKLHLICMKTERGGGSSVPNHFTMMCSTCNPKSATYNLLQMTVSNFTAFSKITNKA